MGWEPWARLVCVPWVVTHAPTCAYPQIRLPGIVWTWQTCFIFLFLAHMYFMCDASCVTVKEGLRQEGEENKSISCELRKPQGHGSLRRCSCNPTPPRAQLNPNSSCHHPPPVKLIVHLLGSHSSLCSPERDNWIPHLWPQPHRRIALMDFYCLMYPLSLFVSCFSFTQATLWWDDKTLIIHNTYLVRKQLRMSPGKWISSSYCVRKPPKLLYAFINVRLLNW